MNEILLNKNTSKKSTNVNNTLNVSLGGNKKLLPSDDLYTKVNLVKQYNKERLSCNNIRLTCIINPICSNVLFNNMTEIIKDEGSPSVISLNYTPQDSIRGTVGKTIKWTDYEATRDTQISNEACGYSYHCGLNIFNNHLIRSKTFKTVCKNNTNTANFNTIEDLMRDGKGNQVSGYTDINSAASSPNTKMHLYLFEDILTFKQAISDRLIEENGWFGFNNTSKMITYKDMNTNEVLDINKPINYKKACDFVDMYPERDLFSFNPKHNKFRNRIEKNWNYCLTYPSSSITENISFINKSNNGLKTIYFDDNVKDYNGSDDIVFYSISKHGLKVNDTVNVYKNNDIFIRDAKVVMVTDDYIFSVFKNGLVISESWIELEDNVTKYKSGTRSFTLNNSKTALFEDDSNNIYYVVNDKRVNIDITAQNVSYKKVINGIECEYYVRIFSRIPNWRFASTKPTDYEINKPNGLLLKKYQTLDNDFENHLTKMAYAKNAYSDDISQIVYTDDINLMYLKDNLGRPLTDIFLTLIKNNKGHKEWYGKNGMTIDIKSDKVEFSHCFGKVNCAFKLSDESLVDDVKYPNVISINTIDNKNGMIIDDVLRETNGANTIDSDEIDYENDIHYYGDLCCFSSIESTETSLQFVSHRFNTAQRELSTRDTSYKYFDEMKCDMIISFDDYDDKGFTLKKENIKDATRRKEGYYYNPHYKIAVKTLSYDLKTQYPKFFTMKGFKKNTDNSYEIFTLENNYLELYDKFVLYDKQSNKYYYGEVEKLLNLRKFTCKLLDSKHNEVNLNIDKYSNYKILKPDITIPSYARLATDGTCRYFWRDVLQNGFDNDSEVEIYPFTNDGLYINLNVDLYVKRQDALNVLKNYSINGTSMKSNVFPYDIEPKALNIDSEDNFYNDLEITC